MYSPPVVTVRVCVYCAVSGSSNTVSVPSVTVMESLVQVTVVAGPPVEIQVRVIWSESNVTSSPDIMMSPVLVVAWARVPHWSCWHSCDVMPEGLTSQLCQQLQCGHEGKPRQQLICCRSHSNCLFQRKIAQRCIILYTKPYIPPPAVFQNLLCHVMSTILDDKIRKCATLELLAHFSL